jgi:hypothetical protein
MLPPSSEQIIIVFSSQTALASFLDVLLFIHQLLLINF